MNSKLKFITILCCSFLIISISLIGLRSYHFTKLTDSSIMAKSHLEEMGFFVLYYSGNYGPYSLTEISIHEKPHSDILAVQDQPADAFLGRELYHKFFFVANHPLNRLGHTHVSVIMDGEEIIGGFSTKKGMTYSLNRGN